MSSALAIAAVTAVLRDLLHNGLIDHDVASSVGDVTVSALPPDRIVPSNGSERTQLNIFLYQVAPNAAWRNVGLPARDARGERIANPPLALDLHYLMTAYGAQDFHAEILLGYAMQLLHETPVLTRAAIRTALAPPSPVTAGGGLPPAMAALFTSGLADQVEQIKISPLSLGTEELSRLWAAIQAHYRPTAAYQASVVLIESRASTRAALPVRERGVYVVPFRQPTIERVESADGPGQPIVAGGRLRLVGQRLRGPVTRVLVGGVEVTPPTADLSDTRIDLDLPGSLRAGLQGVQVVQPLLMGSPPTPHPGVESNLAAFVLQPTVNSIGKANVETDDVDGTTMVKADLTVDFAPPVGREQQVVLLLNELAPPGAVQARAYSFPAAPRPPTGPPQADSLTIPVAGVVAGDYLVRARVDGAESPLVADAAGRFSGPLVTLP